VFVGGGGWEHAYDVGNDVQEANAYLPHGTNCLEVYSTL